jgi:hypothetical protein
LTESETTLAAGTHIPSPEAKRNLFDKLGSCLTENTIVGIEQNPKTKSRWAQMAGSGKKVMQFIQDGRYVAVVADGKVGMFGKRTA